MKKDEITEFMDKLYYGEEIVFEFGSTKYFIQGWKEKETCVMVLDTVSENRFQGYLWQYQAKSMKACADAFLSAPIWDGKDFLQIQDSVIWSDW